MNLGPAATMWWWGALRLGSGSMRNAPIDRQRARTIIRPAKDENTGGRSLKRRTGARCDGRTRGRHVDGRAKWERRAARPKRQRQAAKRVRRAARQRRRLDPLERNSAAQESLRRVRRFGVGAQLFAFFAGASGVPGGVTLGEGVSAGSCQ